MQKSQESRLNKIEQDKATVRMMIELYAKHHPDFDLSLVDYACRRLDHCPFSDQKPACKDCPHHCYSPDKRDAIRKVMRWAGPRMFIYSPRSAFRHVCQIIKYKLKNH